MQCEERAKPLYVRTGQRYPQCAMNTGGKSIKRSPYRSLVFLGGYYQALLRLIDRKVLCGCFYLRIMPAIYALFLHRLYSLKIDIMFRMSWSFFSISTEIGFTN